MSLALSARAADFAALDIPLVVLALPANGTVDDALNPLDRRSGGILRRTLERREFRGGRDELLHLSTAAAGIERLLLVGMGKAEDRVASLRRAAALAARQAVKLGVARFAFFAANITETEAEATAVGLIAGAWDFKELKTPPPADDRRDPVEEAIVLASSPDAQRGVKTGIAIGEGHSLARRLGMLPGNICTPDYLANTAREIGQRYGMTVTVLGRAEMEREKMGSFLCVAQGTPEEDPKLIVLEHRRGPRDAKPVGLVGKGLCFDSGGISIKPAQGMEWMKFDMCGAAGVLGAMETIGRLQLPTNVVGFVGSTTNMPSGTAVKPGDVVQASNGKYIEIINTDAEGRLVLADVLAYAARYNPAAVIDAATLTGACVIALGHTATGVMGTDEGLVQEVLNAAKRAGEPGWPLPLWDDYKELIKSDVADIKNSGGRPAGTITAALFLKEFAEPYPWVHLDIAGTAYTESDLGTIPRGPTGVPVGTFVEFVRGRTR
jgi:leucyl aminopeptidase